MARLALATLLVAAPLAAQDTPLDAFRGNLAAIHARDRSAYLSHYLHTPALTRVGADGVHQGYDDFARGAGDGWPDTLVATHLRVVPLSPDVAYGAYRYRVVDSSGSARGVSERVFIRTPSGWKVAVTTAFPTRNVDPPPMALVGATLVDGTGAAPVGDAVVVMRDGRIACAGSRAACPVPADADSVNAAGKWIIPGLIDTHVHFSQTGWVDGRPDALDLRDRYPYAQVEADLHAQPERLYRSYLCSGVTSVFDVGGYPWTLELQERTARSTTAPRVVAAGPLLSTIDFWLNLPDQRQFIYMSDEAAVRAAVRAHKAWGAAAIKVWYIMPPQPPDTARVSALVHAAGDEARKVGLPLIVHATGLWEAKDAVRAGARVLVHSVWSAPVDDEFLTLVRRQGTIYVPTLTVPDGYRQVSARRFERDRHRGAGTASQCGRRRRAGGANRAEPGAGAGESQAGARRRHPCGVGHGRGQPAHATRGVGVHGARGDASSGARAPRRPHLGHAHRGYCIRIGQYGHCRRRLGGRSGRARCRSARRRPQRAADRAGGASRRDLHAARAGIPLGKPLHKSREVGGGGVPR